MKKSKNTNRNSPSSSSRTSGLNNKSRNATNRPKSLNEAIAKYTGNRYLTHKERKRKRKLEEVDNVSIKDEEGEDKGEVQDDQDLDDEAEDQEEEEGEEEEEEEVQEPVTKKSRGMWGAIKSFWSGTPTPTGSADEDLGEEIGEEIEIEKETESPEEKEEGSSQAEDESSPGEVFAETSPFTGFSEPEKSEDAEEEDDDEDFTGQSESSDESDDEEEDEEEESAEVNTEADDVDDDLEKLKHDLKVDQLINSKDEQDDEDDEDDEDEEEEEEEEEQSKTGLEESKKRSSTPPTSPEEDDVEEKSIKPIPTLNQKQEETQEVEYYDINEDYNDRGSNGSNRIYKNWRELAKNKPPVGLLNHGVTCYMNSAIQAMIHIPAVQHYLNDVNNNKIKDLKPRSVTHVLAELSKRMWMGDKKYINPKKIIQRLDEINCMMSEWQQEDSHEYYMSLMSRLQEDSTPKGKKLNESIIYDIFGGLLKQRITCHKCHNVSATNQEFYDLSLGLNRKKFKNSNKFSIEKSINEFFSNELIKKTEENKSGYYCENCKMFTYANKISTIKIAPETLTIHFKRFKFNNNSSSKVKQLINYSKFLNLSKYMEDKEEKAVYKLISVIVHEGRSISSGHYVSHCLQPDGYTWCTYDDEYINKIEERVALNDPSAYVLVYTKLTPKEMASE